MPAPADVLAAVATATAAGLVGSFAVMRRMALASDALSHVALPGIAIAILLRVDPVLGGFAALFAGTLLVWALERTRVPTEALIGVVFSAALAIGSMLTSGPDLIDALFGAPRTLGRAEALVAIVAAALVVGFVLRAHAHLVVTLVSPDLARTAGVHVARVDLAFLLAFATTVALGLRYLGVLLTGSLVIIPAATAKYLARGVRQMQLFSAGVAIAATLAGMVAAPLLRVEAGPLTITIAAGMFFAALLRRREG